MGQGYVRNDTSNNIANGNTASADDIDGEFDAIQSAFVSTTGHTHDGTDAEGGAVTVTGPAQDYVSGAGDFSPKTDSAYSLGTTSVRWSTGYLDDLVLTNALPVAQGGTGSNTASTARTALGVAVGSDVQAWSAVLDGTTASYTTAEETKLAGIEALADVTDTANVTAAGALMDSEVDADIKTLSLPANTTISSYGATLIDDPNPAAARDTLNLGSMSRQNSGTVSITGGTITGITDLAVADGGTGASTAAGALSNLGLTATAAELNFVDGVTSAIQTQLNSKVPTARTITAGTGLSGGGNLSANRTINVVKASTSAAQAGTGTGLMDSTLTKAAIDAQVGMPRIATWTHSTNVESVEFTGLGDWDQIEIEVVGVTLDPITAFRMTVSFNNGSTYQTSGYDSKVFDSTGDYLVTDRLSLIRSGTSVPTALYRLSSMASAGISVFNGSAVEDGGACVSGGTAPAGIVNAISLGTVFSGRILTAGTINIYGVRRV
jgi:hypothetical protein